MKTQINEDWLIGFTDGEGCFHIQKVKKWQIPVFVIANINEDTLKSIKEFLGCGKIYKVQHQGPKKNGTIYHYRVHRHEDIMNRIIPFFKEKLIVKKQQYDIWADCATRICQKHRNKRVFLKKI